MATVRLFAAAAEAAGCEQTSVDGVTVGAVKRQLVEAHGDGFAHVLRQCAVMVDGRRADDDHRVGDAVVDVLPPFAGG